MQKFLLPLKKGVHMSTKHHFNYIKILDEIKSHYSHAGVDSIELKLVQLFFTVSTVETLSQVLSKILEKTKHDDNYSFDQLEKNKLPPDTQQDILLAFSKHRFKITKDLHALREAIKLLENLHIKESENNADTTRN